MWRRKADDVLVSVVPEQLSEGASREEASHLAGMADLVEEVGVDVERGADPRMTEDAAHLGHVQPQINDQVARECVPEIVEAQPRPGAG